MGEEMMSDSQERLSEEGSGWEPMDGLLITEIFNLADGRVEINWAPVDRPIPDEIEYLSEREDLGVHRTEMQAKLRESDVHYLFSDDARWRGIRCTKEFWCLYMRSRGWGDEQAEKFKALVKSAPKKKIIPIEAAGK